MASVKRVVSRVKPAASSKPKKAKSRKVSPSAASAHLSKKHAKAAQVAGLELPTGPKEAILDIGRYSILLYGQPGIGKTEAFASFPGALFATTEPGTMGLGGIHEFNEKGGGVTSWPIMLKLVELIETSDRYKSVIIDTAEEAYGQCVDYVCERDNIADPSEGEGGRGWRSVRKEFTSTINRIIRSGRACHFTSHSKNIEVKEHSGRKYNRVIPTLTGQARSVIEPLVAFIWYMDYMRSNEDTDVERVIFTQGDDYVTGKTHSVGPNSHFPRLLPAIHGGVYELLVAAANGEDVGLDPNTLLPTKQTLEAVHKHMGTVKGVAHKREARRTVNRVGRGS